MDEMKLSLAQGYAIIGLTATFLGGLVDQHFLSDRATAVVVLLVGLLHGVSMLHSDTK